ncbi:hypothetical protein F3Y22_tig00111164pilonHSYRG00030 [Hibiscus syriacus]|uniref:Uncharacterized protein n=1 Tax=Hibiscus syriacus TaxID=106335 RepID=A0A6A2YXH1_HIBSY|nr:hypothetical protein F3Y22_tig00111164pilonHSYRG00030 [Hibiscus syriacus]
MCQKSAAEHPFKAVLTSLPKPGGGEFGRFYSLPALNDPRIDKLSYSIKILLESADFIRVPAVVDLACMRDTMHKLGSDTSKINHLVLVDLVIDHSVQVDVTRSENAVQANMELEFQRNNERFSFLKLGSTGFHNILVVPSSYGIVHQVNLEYLGRVVFNTNGMLYPDSVVGTDFHTTMIDGLGVAGWGVGGIEAEEAMLGQPMSMVFPGVVGFKLSGKLRIGVTATDLVLTVTQMLRKHSVVGKFVEFYGDKLGYLSVTDFQLLKEAVDLNIRIQTDKDNGIITTIDSGIDNNLINQFRVGFYSAYLVSDKVVVSTKSLKSYVWEGEANESSYSIWEETNPEWIQKLVKNYSQFVSFQSYTWQEKGITKEVKVDEDLVEAKEPGQDENIEKKKKTKKVVERYCDWELINETQPIWNMCTYLREYVGVLRRTILDLRIYSREEEYSNGYEVSTLLSWYREIIDRTIILINMVNAKTYELSIQEPHLAIGFLPLHSDGLQVGQLVTLKRRNERPKDIGKSKVSQNNDENIIKHADKNRSERQFQMGEKEYLRLQPYRQTSIDLHKNLTLAAKYYEPYKIIEKIGEVAYRVDLPNSFRLHPVFHVSILTKHVGDSTVSSTDPLAMDNDGQIRIEPYKGMGKRIINRRNKPVTQLLVHWTYLDETNDIWEDYIVLRGQFPGFDPWGQGSIPAAGIVTVGRDERGREEGIGESRSRGLEIEGFENGGFRD